MAQQGLFGSNIPQFNFFNAPTVEQARQARRENLFARAIEAGQGSSAAALGAHLGRIGRQLFGGEGEQVQRAKRMQKVRQRVGQEVDDIRSIITDDAALDKVTNILSEEGFDKEAQTLPLQVLQIRSQMPQQEPQSRRVTIQGGTPKARAFAKRTGFSVPEGRTFSVEVVGDRVLDDEDITGKQDSTQTEREVQRLIERGFSRPDAEDIAFGRVKISTHPVTGKPQLVNTATGKTRPAISGTTRQPSRDSRGPAPRGEAGVETPKLPVETKQAQGLLDEELEVGLIPWLQEGVSKTFGQFFDSANNPSVTRARTKLRQSQQQLVDALAVSGKPPVIEQERIVNNLPSLGPFESPERARTQLDTLLDDLMVQREADKRAIENEELNPKLRKDIQRRVNAVEKMIRLVDPNRLSGRNEGGQRGSEEPGITADFLRQNAEEQRTVDGKTFYFYNGKWWTE